MISFDLDMTLLDHRTDQITPSALEAIESYARSTRLCWQRGAIWIIITVHRTGTSSVRMRLYI